MSRIVRQNRKCLAASPTPRSLSRSACYVLAPGIGISLCMVWMLNGTEVPHYWKMTQELEQTKADITELKRTNAAFREEIRLVQSDPFTLEKLAREQLGYVKEGETVYQFVESP